MFFSLFIAKHGPDMLLNQLESVQAGLLEQFLTHVWAPKLALVVTDATDKKICQVSVKKRKKKKARNHRASCAARTMRTARSGEGVAAERRRGVAARMWRGMRRVRVLVVLTGLNQSVAYRTN